jgi:hypothetical protein
VAGREDDLTALLRERGALPAGTRILAAWSGLLVDLTGTGAEEVAVSDRSGAVLGVTARTAHLLSRRGLLSFDLNRVRGARSPRVGLLRFSVVREGRARIDIAMAVDGALAIAGQLIDWREQSAAPPPASRIPPAKSRAIPTPTAH